MSENDYEDNYDDDPTPTPDVYRRRRLIAVGAIIIILLLIIWGIVSLVGAMSGDDKKAEEATPSPSVSSEPFSDFSARPSESSSADPSASASGSASASSSTTAEPTESAAPTESTPVATPTTPAVAAACSASDMNIGITADKEAYAAGQNPALTVTYTNVSGNPCFVGGDTPAVDINIISGPAQVYNLAQCTPQDNAQAELAAGASATKSITWDRSLNALGCGTGQSVQPGSYWATAIVNGVPSTPTRILITG